MKNSTDTIENNLSVWGIIQRVSFVLVLSSAAVKGCPGGLSVSVEHSCLIQGNDSTDTAVYKLC